MTKGTTELVTIAATRRTEIGKGYGRRLRRTGKIAGVILEKGKTSMIEFDPKLLSKAWQGGKHFNLDFEGKVKKVFIKELQIDVVKRTPLHVDLVFA